jgi:hypothetical protein
LRSRVRARLIRDFFGVAAGRLCPRLAGVRFVGLVLLIDDVVAFFELVLEVVLAHLATAYPTTAGANSLAGKLVGEERARIGAPGKLGRFGFDIERREECVAPLRSIQIAGQLDDRRIVERRVALQRPSCGEDEQGAPDRRISLFVRQRDVRYRPIGGENELELVSRSGTRLRSSRA